MNLVRLNDETVNANAAARSRLLSRPCEPLFLADWERVLMIHLAVDPEALRRAVPFELDLREGRAFVSVVAFTMRGMRPRWSGRPGAWLLRPIATHQFLNVRTYVRHGGEAGIHFMAEWLNNRLAVRLGPRTFGLPYHFGHLDYQHHWPRGGVNGRVVDAATGAALAYRARAGGGGLAPCEPGSPDEWLMERFTAFTHHRGVRRFFRVWHEPWQQTPVRAELLDHTLLTRHWPFLGEARVAGANYSPGARNVWMGWPHRVC